jgi:hypothetical protein
MTKFPSNSIRTTVFWGGVIFALLVVYTVYNRYVFNDVISVCGKFVGEGSMKGAQKYNVTVKYGNKIHHLSIYKDLIKEEIDLDSLLKIECVQIEMSTIDQNSFNLVDNRILRK